MPTPDHVREREAREARRRGEFVGFLACPHRGGRVLKVALPDQRRSLRARCPVEGCPEGAHETGNAMARPRHRGEICDVSIDGAPIDTPDNLEPDAAELEAIEAAAPAESQGEDHRHRFSDEELVAALTVEPQRAAVVARSLGVKQSATVTARCEALDGAEVIHQGAGRPTLVYREPS